MPCVFLSVKNSRLTCILGKDTISEICEFPEEFEEKEKECPDCIEDELEPLDGEE